MKRYARTAPSVDGLRRAGDRSGAAERGTGPTVLLARPLAREQEAVVDVGGEAGGGGGGRWRGGGGRRGAARRGRRGSCGRRRRCDSGRLRGPRLRSRRNGARCR